MEDLDFDEIMDSGFNVITEEIKFSDDIDEKENQKDFPILPVRNMTLFPEVITPITAGRKSSIKLLEDAYENNDFIGVISQKNTEINSPTEKDIYKVGTVAQILKIIKLPEGNITAITRGLLRFKLTKVNQKKPYWVAEINQLKDTKPRNKNEYEATIDNIKTLSEKIIDIDGNIPNAAKMAIRNINENDALLNFVCSNASFSNEQKQALLEEKSLLKRAKKCYEGLFLHFDKVKLRNAIHQKTSKSLDQQQREYFLNQQMKTIKEELGLGNEHSEIDDLKAKAEKINWSDEVQIHFEKELNRLSKQHPNSPDYNVQRNYLDFFTDLPWETYSKDVFNIKKAEKILDKDHFGLEDIKKRILEHMAVLKLKKNMKSPILCLAGPPGVGKTSLGKSIASSLGRKYARISLGGLHDESEIRGHRKTYIGAMAGRILQSIKKLGVSNPVIVLDEIDKLGQGTHGDPSSALLEVLDPEQNHQFYDNYLEQGYDLSKVMFIATANNLGSIQRPLLDRMEIISIAGYTLEEKVEIAKRHLIKKQIEANGLAKNAFKIGVKELKHIIEAHTSESGVRSLEKKIASIARHIAFQTAIEEEYNPKISIEKIDEILGVPRPKALSETTGATGVVTGLAWTSVGGDILYIESILSKGKGTLSLTGNLGTVMKESATIALEYIKAKHEELGVSEEELSSKNVHIHVPEGATPKDGPSAGIAMLTSLVSSFRGKKVKPHLAMTGEITLRGKVLPVGGIKEKLLAATRAGVKTVILCESNRKDVEEIKQDYLKNMNIHYVTKMKEVIDLAIEK
ncbi:MAG: endopeptidase La [Flavobacteriales bacterium]|nr:MAG: endopeptidase La [Flavobacteriales bacterium]